MIVIAIINSEQECEPRQTFTTINLFILWRKRGHSNGAAPVILIMPPRKKNEISQVFTYQMFQAITFEREALPHDTSPGPCPAGQSPASPLQLTPVLVETQISRLAEAAEALVKTLPQFEPKPHNTKKKICRDLEVSGGPMDEKAD